MMENSRPIDTLSEVLREQAERERQMLFHHKWVGLVWNYVIGLTLIVLFWSFVWWSVQIKTDRKVADGVAEAQAAWQAQQTAAAEQAKAEAEEQAAAAEQVQIKEAQAVARAFYGVRNFVDKYGYSNSDLETYARCIFNRADVRGKSVEEVLAEPGQFMAYTDKNTLVKEYYDLALQFVAAWHSEDVPPCDAQKFQAAVFKPEGIWLIDDPGKEVPDRWHA